jgi:hypothetical protein
MPSRSIRVSVVAVMLVSFLGCDPNSGGPSAPTEPVPNAGKDSEGGLKGSIKTQNGKGSKQIEGPKPRKPD